MLPNDESIVEQAEKILSAGGNILIFPEGTRTPLDGTTMPTLKRGAAQLAIRLGVPVATIRIDVSRRILAKGQFALDMGESTVLYRIASGRCIVSPKMEIVNRAGAMRLTKAIAEEIMQSS